MWELRQYVLLQEMLVTYPMELFIVSIFLMLFDIQEIIMFNFQPLTFEVPACHSIKDENPAKGSKK